MVQTRMQFRLDSLPLAGPSDLYGSPLGARVLVELERKLSWAVAYVYAESYQRRGELARVARRIALHLVIENGLPVK